MSQRYGFDHLKDSLHAYYVGVAVEVMDSIAERRQKLFPDLR